MKVELPQRDAWNAVYATGFGVAGLSAAEMLPVSLLTPMARGLGISEGMTGQALTTTAVAALVSSLLTAAVTRRLDRRTVLLWLSALQVASNLVVALAPSLLMLLVGRLLLGISVGGFWAMSAVLATRLVPAASVPKAFSIIFGGGSIATIAAAPLGSFLGGLIGWRDVFLLTGVLAGIALAWQIASLPAMPSSGRIRLSAPFRLLARPQVRLGVCGAALVFAGHFAFFTYLRPFLETVTHLSGGSVSIILLMFGIGNFAGTALAGAMVARNLRMTLALTPLLLGVLAIAMTVLGHSAALTLAAVMAWGFGFGTVPVAWTTWLTRTVPYETESGGGLIVASIQIAITAGASLGGFTVDHSGVVGTFGLSAAILIAAGLIIFLALRSKSAPHPTMAGSA